MQGRVDQTASQQTGTRSLRTGSSKWVCEQSACEWHVRELVRTRNPPDVAIASLLSSTISDVSILSLWHDDYEISGGRPVGVVRWSEPFHVTDPYMSCHLDQSTSASGWQQLNRSERVVFWHSNRYLRRLLGHHCCSGPQSLIFNH